MQTSTKCIDLQIFLIVSNRHSQLPKSLKAFIQIKKKRFTFAWTDMKLAYLQIMQSLTAHITVLLTHTMSVCLIALYLIYEYIGQTMAKHAYYFEQYT